MSKSATKEQMEQLHETLARVLITAIEPEESTIEMPDGESIVINKVSPALLTVAAKFLKDNDITCQEGEGNKLSELEEKLRSKRERRLATVTPLHPDTAVSSC